MYLQDSSYLHLLDILDTQSEANRVLVFYFIITFLPFIILTPRRGASSLLPLRS